ncbi:hypothetical protein [Thalassovita aquimarina]|uniref:ParB/Sulfiredoxin domain-containing protein n=1 Tax=Thalassovita aquimarina TaxID=2785917 RepID=A0ABS5HTB0_9RHOB|nr:hypothetical protein [Thalassovita aquimarina]MBR9652219.1 hypothetical protein [Thalassovita aquimarina]
MPEVKKIGLNRLILHEDNPRFEGVLDEEAAIAALCANEKVLELARDISENGLSPLERFMVFREDPDDDPTDANYVVAEGNRRLCALKLLKDPKRAPSTMRDALKRAKAKFKVPRSIEVIVEEDEDERRKWIERAHAGTLSGKGRKAWNTVQKTRHFKHPRNLRGQAVMDYAVARGFVSKDETEGRLSHVVRLVGNPVMRAALGLHFEKDPTEPYRDRPLEDFDKLAKWLMEEALVKRLGSQADKKVINDKAHQLEGELGCSSVRLSQPELLANDLVEKKSEKVGTGEHCTEGAGTSATSTQQTSAGDKQDSAKVNQDDSGESKYDGNETKSDRESGSIPPKPKRPEPSKNMPYSEAVEALLKELGNYKLQSLYYSISTITMKDHVPTLFVAAWSLLDSLSIALGRPETGNISQHWQRKNLLNKDLCFSKDTAKSVEGAFDRIRIHGNDTKHHPTSAGFDAQQLKSDWEMILPVLDHDLRKHLRK